MDELSQPEKYPVSSRYTPEWILGLDMGPHPLWQLEDLLADFELRPGARVLDLGCGRGATSVFLAEQLGVHVVAFDSWVSEEVIRGVTGESHASDLIEVRNGDARLFPFEDGEFDAVVSVDAFEYFGTDVRFLPGLLRCVREGGRVGMTTPALVPDPYVAGIPPAVFDVVSWEAAAWHDPEWWVTHWELTGMVTDVRARLQDAGRDDWLRWSEALGETSDAPVQRMLRSMSNNQVGFAVVSAAKR